MAKYTIELKDVVALGHNVFDFNYPFYDESKRADFERKFIQHFYFREIGSPTIDRFKHYLKDKMLTVFPYYNELFNAAAIDYSILNNYNLTEEFTTTRETQGKSSGFSSSVGQLFDSQESESNQNRTINTVGNVDTTGKDTETETTNADTTGSQTVDGSSTKESVKKFLDTPQGLTDLSNSKYLTTLNQDNDSVTDHNETATTGNTKTTRNGEKNSSVMQESDGTETTTDKVTNTATGEQKSTSDNNTRTYTDGKQTESHKLTRIGNIGVDTDSDMIEKHIRLQKTLTQIERLFFDECEDLFMLVY